MQAILSKYIPATNHKGSRIKASCERGSIIIPYDSGLDDTATHRLAAQKLIQRFLDEDTKKYGTPPASNPWGRPFFTGTLPGRNGERAHVYGPRQTPAPENDKPQNP